MRLLDAIDLLRRIDQDSRERDFHLYEDFPPQLLIGSDSLEPMAEDWYLFVRFGTVAGYPTRWQHWLELRKVLTQRRNGQIRDEERAVQLADRRAG